MATSSAIRMVLQRQVGLIRRGLFGVPSRWLQKSSYNLSEEKQNSADSRNEAFDSASTESANKKYFDDDDGAAFIDADEDQETDVREHILNAALEHVHELSWSSEAIEAGASAVGLSAMAEGMFPRGAGDLVLHFTENCNVRLADHLVSQSKSAGKEETSGVPLQKSSQMIIRDAVEVRLRMLIPFIDQWPQAMGLMLLPQNAPDALKNVAYLVDEIWYHAGDTSTDVNWYTKRGVLAGLYGATELYMVTDRSSDFEDTWSFLDRRLSDIGLLIGAKETLEKAGSDGAELLSAAFTTVRNMSGLNRRSR